MAETFTLHGVPQSIATDGWWLDAPNGGGPESPTRPRRVGSGRALAMLALIGLADLLFWGHDAGLSLVLFAWAIFAVAAVRHGKVAVRPLVLLALGSLPVIDYAQFLSVAFLTAVLLGSLVWVLLPEAGLATRLIAATRLAGRLPVHGLAAVFRGVRALAPVQGSAGRLRETWRSWAFPIGGTLVFGLLLADANPLIARVIWFDFDPGDLVERGLFWLGIGLMLWPLIDGAPASTQAFRKLPALPRLGINATSTLRALWMFNLLIGVQTVLDLTILVGGASLPSGMTHAEYAHRGAYPLLATALLAGAFALAARPHLAEHRALKPLLLLWLAQNVALSLSAALRLHLYVQAYGLTYLRLDALIWMALVAAGLALTLWQVWRGKSNGWLMLRASALGLGVLYACCFVNFAAVIAETNLAQHRANWDYLDWCYLGDLGPMASGAIEQAMATDPAFRAAAAAYGFRNLPPEPQGWREWGFRNAWVLHTLAAVKEGGRRGEDTRGR